MEAKYSPRSPARLQIILGAAVAVFFIAILSVIFISFRGSASARETFLVDSEALATLSNIQRHWLSLHVETRAWLDNPGAGTEQIENQRAFLNSQLRIIKPYIAGNLSVSRRLLSIEARLEQYDALLAEAQASDNPQAYKDSLIEILQGVETEHIKRAYDQVERNFFVTLSQTLAAQQNIQSLLIVLAALFALFVIAAGIWAARVARATAELQRNQVLTLEQSVADRTRALITSSEVSRRLSTIFDRNTLVQEVVNQVNKAFGYYHSQIYFFDEARENLVMAGGTGEAGAMMLAQFHKLAKGRGLVGNAAETNQTVLVADTMQNPEWLPNPLLPDTRSEAAIPISVGEQVLGVLDVQQNSPNGLQKEDLDSLESIANQVAVGLQNIRSIETVDKRARQLSAVAEISSLAAQERDEAKMLQSMVYLTQRRFDWYHAHVFTFNPNSEKMEIQACGWQAGDEHEGTHGTTAIPLLQEQSLVARAGRERQAVIVNDVLNEPGWLPNPLLPETRAEMAVPLVAGDELLGVLDVQSARLGAFTQEDADIQTTLASQLAVALQNLRALQQSRRQAERQTAINLIAQKIQSAAKVGDALQIAAREMGHALGGKSVAVVLDAASKPSGDDHE